MRLTDFFIPLAVVVLLSFALRYYRAGTGPFAFVFIEDEFRAYRQGKFVGSTATVLYSDMRIDRFAPSEFNEARGPL